MTTEPAGSGWRLRWANRQNERLRNAFDASFAAWQRDDDEARRMLRVAGEFHGLSHDQLPPNADLHRGEIVLSVTPGVAMVETANEPALHAPGYAGFSIYQAPPAAPQASTTVDTGVAAVTNKRVVFYGNRKHREWAFAKLIGIAHSPDNRTTLMRVSNRVKVSGLAMDPPHARSFRFTITLGLADHAGDRAGFVAYLENMIAGHQRLRPEPPAVVMPEQAPPLARIRPGMAITVAAAAVIILCTVIGLVAPKPAQDKPNLSAGTASSVTQPLPSTRRQAPAPTPSTALTESPTAAPTPSRVGEPSPQQINPQPPPPPPPPPQPQPPDLCGAPQNPYGYNFCGGSLIFDPKPDICDYFSCIDNFWNGKGYMIQCNDGMVSMSGGRQGSCSYHRGNRRPVYG